MSIRKEYWNKYIDYWRARTSEAEKSGKGAPAGNTPISAARVYNTFIDDLNITSSDIVLEVGCGLGRSIDFLLTKSKCLYVIDISEKMIFAVKDKYINKLKGMVVAEAEKLPFKDNYFTKIVCFTVYDALFQKEALIEMNSKLRLGGQVMITGKNDNYQDNDENAFIAEVKARENGHPNYFTDTVKLLAHLDAFGFKKSKGYFYEKRGDIATNKYITDSGIKEDGKFYEYCLYLEKTGETDKDICKSIKISSAQSKTLKRRHVSK